MRKHGCWLVCVYELLLRDTMKILLSLSKYYPKESESFGYVDKKPSDYLISISAYWLSEDIIFIRNSLSKDTYLQDNWSDYRAHIAEYNLSNQSIQIYIVRIDKGGLLLVGVLEPEDKIIFELPLSDSEEALLRAERNDFQVRGPVKDHDGIEGDAISRTYHDINHRYLDNNSISYTKFIAKKYTLYVDIDY